MAAVPQAYLISRYAVVHIARQDLTDNLFPRSFIDPLFGIAVGLSAMVLRVQRDQREQHPEQDNSFSAIYERARRYNRIYWGHEA
jgi:hypothetical protein